MLNFDNGDTEFPLPNSAARAWSARSEKEKIKKIKIDKRIVVMPLPKQGYKIFFYSNCGNGIAENGGEKVTKSMKE